MLALIVPWLGSFSYMKRQITPAAKSEIAIGMKTATLNAVENRTRSSRTAKTSPIAVTNAGTTREPEEVVLDRGPERLVGEERLVVVEPDELVAAPVVEAADDRADRRVDDPDPEQHQRGPEEHGDDPVALPQARHSVPWWEPLLEGSHRRCGLGHAG